MSKPRIELSDREASQIERELGLTDDSIGEDDLGTSDLGGDAAGVEVHDEPIHVYDHGGANMQIVDAKTEGPFKDDWDALIEQRERAKVGPNGEALSEFDTMFQLQQSQNADRQATAPSVSTNPASVMAGILGSQATISTLPATGGSYHTGQPVTVAYWVGDDSETMPITVTLTPVQGIPSVGTLGYFRPIARVSFGTRDFQTTIEVDVNPGGCQFTVSGSSCTVSIYMAGGDTGVANGLVSSMIVAGMISFRDVMRVTPVTRTIEFDSTPPGGYQAGVPMFAKRFWLLYSDPTSAWSIFFNDFEGRNLYQINVTAGQFQTTPMMLTNGVNSVDAVQTAGSSATVNFLFELF